MVHGVSVIKGIHDELDRKRWAEDVKEKAKALLTALESSETVEKEFRKELRMIAAHYVVHMEDSAESPRLF